MNKKLFALIISFILIASGIACFAASINTAEEDATPETYKDVFKKDNIIDINIDINEADLQDMYDYAVNEEYHSADITIDGVKIENAGIRTKGNMTLSSVANSDSDRYSFRIKFNKYVKGQTFLGLDELCLNNNYSDSTYMREYLHYEILEKLGMNVPNRTYCNVYINGELSGFYLAVEALDDTFLEREFGTNYENGNLYKMDMGATLQYKENEDYTYADLKVGTDVELTQFKNFIKKLNDIEDGEKGDIESFLNVDSALKYIASNTVLCNYDSYNGNNHHNYYLYQDENGVFTVIPWDFNMSFGGFNGNNSTVGIDTPIISGNIETLPLISKLLAVDEYKEKYYGYIKEIMSMLENFEDRVTELKAIIKPYVENDPTAFYTVEEFEKSTTLQENQTQENQTQENAETTKQEANREHQGRQEQPNDDRGGGKPFGGTGSIINCVEDRLKNLNEQFNGTAEKSTKTEEYNRSNKPNESFVPPSNDNNNKIPDNNQPPMRQDDNRQPPDKNGFERKDFGDRDFPKGENENPPQSGMPNEWDKKEKNDIIRVHVDGHIIEFDTSPFIENDTTLVGLRGVLEALGINVAWDKETQTITATKNDTVITLTIGSDTAYINGNAYTLLTAPIISGNSTMVPIRFISEQLGMKVSWNSETKLITVSSK